MKTVILVLSCGKPENQRTSWEIPFYAHGLITRLIEVSKVEILLMDNNNESRHLHEIKSYSGTEIKLNKPRNNILGLPFDERFLDYRPFINDSMRVYEFLKENSYDVVIFDVHNAYGFVPIRSKKVGSDFQDAILMSWFRTCHEFERDQSLYSPGVWDDYMLDRQRDFVERYGCENSDLVLLQADALLEWSKERDWEIDPSAVVRVSEFKDGKMDRFFTDLAKTANKKSTIVEAPDKLPKVSICVAHFNDGKNLVGLLKSIEKNEYENFEVVVVDDGSSDLESLKILRQLQSQYADKNWRFVFKPENESIGPTRNFSVTQATGELIIFMDSDNLATSNMITDFVEGILISGADCLSCSMIQFSGESDEVNHTNIIGFWMPLGTCLEAGIYSNEFGDANFCVRKSVFLELGGFTGVRGEVADDWEFLSRLVLSGRKLEVVPRPLFFYRIRSSSWLKSAWSHHSTQTLRLKILSNTSVSHQKIIHNMLVEMIAENERLISVVSRLDRKIVRIVLRCSELITEKQRVAVVKFFSRIANYCRFDLLSGILEEKIAALKKKYSGIKKSVMTSRLTQQNPLSDETLSACSKKPINGATSLPINESRSSQLAQVLEGWNLPSDRPLFAFIGELTEQTRPLGFLKLAYWMQMLGDNSYFLMLGGGPLSKDVELTVQKFKLKNFKWTLDTKLRHDLFPLLTGFVSTTMSGSLPFEVVEALSHGIPVFAAETPAVKNLLSDYQSGFTVNHDPEKKDFSDCFRMWKDNIELYRSSAIETAPLIQKSFQH